MENYRMFTFKSESDKAIHMLEGILKGISYDSKINNYEINELISWTNAHSNFKDMYPFKEVFEMLDVIMEDNIVSEDERDDLLWFCDQVLTGSKYYDVVTSDLQRLNGILYGIISDKVIKDSEIRKLDEWLVENEHLSSNYPYDELYSLITSILSDGVITEDEKNILERYLLEFIDEKEISNYSNDEIKKIKKSITISGVCSLAPDIKINDSRFVITGKSSNYSRKDFKDMISEKGGKVITAVSGKTDYLVICDEGNPCWAYSCYGRKIEKAMNLRSKGNTITIVRENDLMDYLY